MYTQPFYIPTEIYFAIQDYYPCCKLRSKGFVGVKGSILTVKTSPTSGEVSQ